jgi:hypothetical protein
MGLHPPPRTPSTSTAQPAAPWMLNQVQHDGACKVGATLRPAPKMFAPDNPFRQSPRVALCWGL